MVEHLLLYLYFTEWNIWLSTPFIYSYKLSTLLLILEVHFADIYVCSYIVVLLLLLKLVFSDFFLAIWGDATTFDTLSTYKVEWWRC